MAMVAARVSSDGAASAQAPTPAACAALAAPAPRPAPVIPRSGSGATACFAKFACRFAQRSEGGTQSAQRGRDGRLRADLFYQPGVGGQETHCIVGAHQISSKCAAASIACACAARCGASTARAHRCRLLVVFLAAGRAAHQTHGAPRVSALARAGRRCRRRLHLLVLLRVVAACVVGARNGGREEGARRRTGEG